MPAPHSLASIPLRVTPTGIRVDLRVMPRSGRNAIDGVREGRLVVRVTAAPVDDAANEAVVVVMADLLDLPKRAVRIVSGQTSRSKTVEIAGLDEAELRRRMNVHS
jgi:uncharacterized protein (TIGR00251 family)